MDALDLARWQFAITTVYHFLFVPITIGMSGLVAGFHTAWVRTHNPQWYRLTRFFGKLFLINFALGLVTGIVQEFQFGMNWSDYSRFIGDIFGAPLAFEALLSFFLESVFIGLWVFGWGRLPEKLHATTMWLVHFGTLLSAYFILTANSFMQNPVGFRYNSATARAELTDFLAVLTNKVQLVTFPHVVTAAYMTGGAVVMAVALYHLRRRYTDPQATVDRDMYRKAARIGAVVTLIASLGVMITGDLQGKVMTEVQPMKMAAAEAHYETSSRAPFSVFTTGDLNGENPRHWIEIPGLLSYLGKGSFDAQIEGIHDLRAQASARFGGNPLTADDATAYTPNIPGTYWSFRFMMGMGFAGTGIALLALWATRKKAPEGTFKPGWWHWPILAAPFLPLLANSFGWIFTEIGRQPWVVHNLMTTQAGVSPSVGVAAVLTSMIVFTLLYGVLAVVEVKLFCKYARLGAEAVGDPLPGGKDPDSTSDPGTLVFAY